LEFLFCELAAPLQSSIHICLTMGNLAFIFAWLASAHHVHRVQAARDTRAFTSPSFVGSQQAESNGQVVGSDPLKALAQVLAAFNFPAQGSRLAIRHASAPSGQQFTTHSQQNVIFDSRRLQRRGEPSAAATSAPAKPMESELFTVLKKPSGALTISLEFNPASGGASTERDVELKSMEMRKSKAAAVFTPDSESVASLVKEQQQSRGDYPGPCPVVFSGDASKAAAAVEAGASAVVLEPKDLEQANTLGVDVLWHVSSSDEVSQIVDAGYGYAFFVSAADATELMPAVPKDALLVAYLDAMQEDGAEVDKGRELNAAGCQSLLVRNACVGDKEDFEYSRYVIGGLRSKASKKYNIGAMTGAVNGHFGMGENWMSSGPKKWQRTAA